MKDTHSGPFHPSDDHNKFRTDMRARRDERSPWTVPMLMVLSRVWPNKQRDKKQRERERNCRTELPLMGRQGQASAPSEIAAQSRAKSDKPPLPTQGSVTTIAESVESGRVVSEGPCLAERCYVGGLDAPNVPTQGGRCRGQAYTSTSACKRGRPRACCFLPSRRCPNTSCEQAQEEQGWTKRATITRQSPRSSANMWRAWGKATHTVSAMSAPRTRFSRTADVCPTRPTRPPELARIGIKIWPKLEQQIWTPPGDARSGCLRKSSWGSVVPGI